MKKNLIAFIAVGLLFVGCQEKQNPALSVDDIQTFATLSGVIYYQHATGVSSTGTALYDSLPLQNQVVEVKVDASQYTQNTWNNTMCTFTGTIDEQGNYQVQVPVIALATNFSIAEISVRPFYMENYPIVTTSYVYDPMAGGYVYRTTINNGQVYCAGVMPGVAVPSLVYANHSYFCGNSVIPATAFVKVGF